LTKNLKLKKISYDRTLKLPKIILKYKTTRNSKNKRKISEILGGDDYLHPNELVMNL
jgi:hypothetical protein